MLKDAVGYIAYGIFALLENSVHISRYYILDKE
jgi:hypothetical protein